VHCPADTIIGWKVPLDYQAAIAMLSKSSAGASEDNNDHSDPTISLRFNTSCLPTTARYSPPDKSNRHALQPEYRSSYHMANPSVGGDVELFGSSVPKAKFERLINSPVFINFRYLISSMLLHPPYITPKVASWITFSRPMKV